MIDVEGNYKEVVEEEFQKWKGIYSQKDVVKQTTKEDIEKFVQLCTDEEVLILGDYEPAFIGVTTDGVAVYNYNKMIEYLLDKGMDLDEAKDHLENNTIKACKYMGEKAPIIMWDIWEN